MAWNWDAITAVGTWIVILPSAVAIWLSARQNRLIHSSQVIAAFQDKWNSEHFQAVRSRFAKSLLEGRGYEFESSEVLFLFETLGNLVHRRIIDRNLAWNALTWDVTHYYAALTASPNQVEKLRRECNDVTLFSEFEWLASALLEMDAAARDLRVADVEPKRDAVMEYLEHEISLGGSNSSRPT